VEDRYCGNCGQELRPDGRFCPNCGQPTAVAQAPTPSPSVQSSAPQQPRQTGRWSAGRVLFLIIVAPVLLAIAWFVFQFSVGFLSGLLGGLLGG
jgi:zinc-ribbon domain